MSKFRSWLIKQLGGYTEQEHIVHKVITHTQQMIKLVAEMRLNKEDIDLLNCDINEYVHKELTDKLAAEMLHNELVTFTSNNNYYDTYFRATVYAGKEIEV